MLKFDASAHRYTWNGSPVPSVTDVLAPLSDFRFVKDDVMRAARDLGSAVHRAIELDSLGDLDDASLDPALVGFVEQYRAFERETGFETAYTELRLFSARYGYAGTMDIVGTFPDDRERGVFSLVDTKSGAVPKTARPQTAGYANLLVENRIAPDMRNVRRFALDLKRERWALSPEYRDPNDLRVFLAALTLHNFKAAA